MYWELLAAVGTCIWLAILLLPWRPWGLGEVLEAAPACPEDDLRDITVLIPARNEAGVMGTTLSHLKRQGRDLKIVVIDDRSTDGTGTTAQNSGIQEIRVVSGEGLPADWTGKIWALEQGFRYVNTPLTLLLDADIDLEPGMLQALRQKLKENRFQLVSVMAHLRMVDFWERLLMPAFVYFFRMLYPFRLSNSGSARVAAAAGGCILLETRVIEEIGGFRAIRNELIDDCAMARRVKSLGYRTWIGLTHSAHSLRSYRDLASIWNMVARTAFCQLRYSIILLAGTTLIMVVVFWLPIGGLFFPTTGAKILSAFALGIAVLTYVPTLKFYRQPRGWAFVLPFIATLYLAMTWSSAVRYWCGSGFSWKGRLYGGNKRVSL